MGPNPLKVDYGSRQGWDSYKLRYKNRIFTCGALRNAGLVVVFSSSSSSSPSLKARKKAKTITQTSELWSAWQVGHKNTYGNVPSSTNVFKKPKSKSSDHSQGTPVTHVTH